MKSKSEPHEKYGIFIPSLNTFMYIQGTKEDFERQLREHGLLEPKKEEQVETFDDFDDVVREVRDTPYSRSSLQL